MCLLRTHTLLAWEDGRPFGSLAVGTADVPDDPASAALFAAVATDDTALLDATTTVSERLPRTPPTLGAASRP